MKLLLIKIIAHCINGTSKPNRFFTNARKKSYIKNPVVNNVKNIKQSETITKENKKKVNVRSRMKRVQIAVLDYFIPDVPIQDFPFSTKVSLW